MPIDSLAKITATRASEVCALAAIAGFKVSAGDEASPTAFVGDLIDRSQFVEAVQFMAFALPKREAVWWACLCARAAGPEPLPETQEAAILAAETWVRQPNEENRRAAMAQAHATDFKSPAAWAATAAFWSGGSLAAEQLPEVAAAPHLLGVAVAGAVTLAAVLNEPEAAHERHQRHLAAAVDIANGGNGRAALVSP